jgi:hypothetical protein
MVESRTCSRVGCRPGGAESRQAADEQNTTRKRLLMERGLEETIVAV